MLLKPGMVVFMVIIPALGRLRQEICKFKGSLGSIARTCLNE
jgi:hypothetical protein